MVFGMNEANVLPQVIAFVLPLVGIVLFAYLVVRVLGRRS